MPLLQKVGDGKRTAIAAYFVKLGKVYLIM